MDMSNVRWDHADQVFQVSNVEMKSDHCSVKGSSNSNSSAPQSQK
jgi:hypothetical protein